MNLKLVGVAARFFGITLPILSWYVSIIVMLISIVSVLMMTQEIKHHQFELGYPVHAVIIGACLSMLYFYHNSYYKNYTDINFSNEKQIEKIRDLIGRTRSNLIIFSGEFSHEVYENDLILSELELLPSNCRLMFYFSESEIDPKSVRFSKFVKKRNAICERVPTIKQGHFAISDRSHVRLEFSRIPHSQPQYASYHYWRPDFSDHVVEKFRHNVLNSDSSISPSKLPV